MKTTGHDFLENSLCDSAASHLKQSAQRDLAAGVLKQAALDLRRYHGATGKLARELYFDAYRRLTVNECSSPFSFLNVCQLLNLAPDRIRHQLLGDASLGVIGYLARRCGRAARWLRGQSPISPCMQGMAALTQTKRSYTMRQLQQWGSIYMKVLTELPGPLGNRKHFAVSPRQKLIIAHWRQGIKTLTRQAQWKLHLTLTQSPLPAFATISGNGHERDVDFSHGNGHLLVRRIRRFA